MKNNKEPAIASQLKNTPTHQFWGYSLKIGVESSPPDAKACYVPSMPHSTTSGLKTAKKITLRCKKCSILFNYAMYGNKEATGFQFYHSEREYIEVSTLYFERRLLEWQCSLA